MQRVITSIDKTVFPDPAKPPFVLAPGVAQDILPDITFSGIEYAGRWILNVGTNPAYLCYGQDAIPGGNYQEVVLPNQQADTAPFPCRISALSDLGTTLVIKVARRNDNFEHTQSRPAIHNS